MQKRECDKDTMVVFGALYFTILLFLSSNIAVAATNTSWVGGNGGSKTESVYCPKDHFIAHINYAKGLARKHLFTMPILAGWDGCFQIGSMITPSMTVTMRSMVFVTIHGAAHIIRSQTQMYWT